MESFDFGKYRLVACDMDGTLLDSGNKIPALHRKAAGICARNGIMFAVVSGRSYIALRPFIETLPECSHVVAYNGGRISTGDFKTELLRITLGMKEVLEVLELAPEYDATACVWADEKLYVNRRNHLAEAYGRLCGCGVTYFEPGDLGFIKGSPDGKSNVDKVFWFDEPSRADAIAESIRGRVPAEVCFLQSGPGCMEFIDKSVSKGGAVVRLAEMLGFSAGEVIAFGDAENDLSMIKAAGLGIAMANAAEIVKQNADHITGTNDEGGVYGALTELFGVKEKKKARVENN